jgi:hypothetical protein
MNPKAWGIAAIVISIVLLLLLVVSAIARTFRACAFSGAAQSLGRTGSASIVIRQECP